MTVDKSIIKYTDMFAYYVYQPIAFFILKRIVKSKITPNQVTVASLIFGIFSAYMIFNQMYILGIVFLNISFVLDCLDGQLARAKNMQSIFGLWLDNVFDRIVENVVIIAIIFVNIENMSVVMVGIFLMFFNLLYSYMSDIVIYREMHSKHNYRRLTIIEKALFSPIYFLNRSFMIGFLSLAIFFPFKVFVLLNGFYFFGIVFHFYREYKNIREV